jgi:hypothetical protein
MVGGGVLGKGAGTKHGIIVRDGHTIMGFHLSMAGYLRDGETITERIVGMVRNGGTKEYLTGIFKRFIK